MMTKADVTEMIMEKRRAGGTSWAAIAQMAGLDEVFVTSACLGMNSLPRDSAEKITKGLGLPQEAAIVLSEYPKK
ncbi:MAG: cyanate hydratase, partial [Sphingomonadaceae bacterium]